MDFFLLYFKGRCAIILDKEGVCMDVSASKNGFLKVAVPYFNQYDEDKEEYQIIKEVAQENSDIVFDITMLRLAQQIQTKPTQIYTDSKEFWFKFDSNDTKYSDLRTINIKLPSSEEWGLINICDRAFQEVNNLLLYDSEHFKQMVAETPFLIYREVPVLDKPTKRTFIGTSPTLIKKHKNNQ